MSTDLVKANNAIVGTVEFYAGAVGSLLAQLRAKNELIEQLGKQLLDHQQQLRAKDELLARCSVDGVVTVGEVKTGTHNPAATDDFRGSPA